MKNNYWLVGFKFCLISLITVPIAFVIGAILGLLGYILGHIFIITDNIAIFMMVLCGIFMILTFTFLWGFFLIKYEKWIYK